jgi:alkanesulfonate monooxygenase SsuD/methylene tetrahydromethanopterin reductase-like flavin-dependent oxidoreductase (luciferase family)
MPTSPCVPVGLNIWSRLVEDTFPYYDQTVAPFDSLWLPDHVQYGANKVAEGWTLLTWALARYPDKLCGHEVLCNSFRNPAHLAKMAATAQALSGGRLVLGIGAGWNEEEYRAYGWPYLTARIRIGQLAEAIELIRRMWGGGPIDFHGEHYTVTGAHCEPRPRPMPPVMVGGSGEKYLLRVVARHADWWNYVWKGPGPTPTSRRCSRTTVARPAVTMTRSSRWSASGS